MKVQRTQADPEALTTTLPVAARRNDDTPGGRGPLLVGGAPRLPDVTVAWMVLAWATTGWAPCPAAQETVYREGQKRERGPG